MDLPEIDVDELERQLATGAPVFDVREDDEWENVHIEGATLVPLGTVTAAVERFPTDRPVYVICAKGGRSARAAEFLRSQGIDAVNVAGGMGAWVESGKPSVSGVGG
ncbi:MAG: rhodanese-like domain-containing protein [Acidimicrobiales bacterium]